MVHGIEKARGLFEQAERETNPERKAQFLEEAIESLDFCEAEDLSASERTLLTNIRVSHTRRLLVQLVSLQSVTMDVWFSYIKLLLVELKDEVALALEQDPALKESYEQFIALWRQELLELIGEQ